MADNEDTAAPEADRIGALESKVDKIITRLGELVRGTGPAAGAHATAAKVTDARLEPQTVEEQVAAALAAKDRQAKEEALHADVASLKETTANLAETPPEPPQRRVEKVMGWGR